MAVINVGVDFSPDPQGRFRTDGDSSGEAFREDFLWPALSKLSAGEKLTIILDDGVETFGSSFLTEGFAGIVKYGYMRPNDLLGVLEFKFQNMDFDFYRKKILRYIAEATFNSKKYIPG